MRSKLMAALAAGGVLVGGGAAAAATVGSGGSAQAAVTSAAVADTTPDAYARGPLASLVADGTITQAQAEAIHNAIRAHMRDHRPSDDRGQAPAVMTGELDTVLAQLVKDGTINESQAAAVKKAITEQVAEHWQNRGGHGRHGEGLRMGMGPWWDDGS